MVRSRRRRAAQTLWSAFVSWIPASRYLFQSQVSSGKGDAPFWKASG